MRGGAGKAPELLSMLLRDRAENVDSDSQHKLVTKLQMPQAEAICLQLLHAPATDRLSGVKKL